MLGYAVEIGNLVGKFVDFVEIIDGEPEGEVLDNRDGGAEGKIVFVIADG